MSTNLAKRRHPLEEIQRPELATNGNYTDYDGARGFAHFKWPGSYTLVLDQPELVSSIRFLLWDKTERAYNYVLSVSEDGEVWVKVAEIQNKEVDGTQGWQIVNFAKPTNLRFTKLEGTWGSANSDFHLVEFEIWTGEPDHAVRGAIFSVGEEQLEALGSAEAGLAHGIERIERILEDGRHRESLEEIAPLIDLYLNTANRVSDGVAFSSEHIENLLINSLEDIYRTLRKMDSAPQETESLLTTLSANLHVQPRINLVLALSRQAEVRTLQLTQTGQNLIEELRSGLDSVSRLEQRTDRLFENLSSEASKISAADYAKIFGNQAKIHSAGFGMAQRFLASGIVIVVSLLVVLFFFFDMSSFEKFDPLAIGYLIRRLIIISILLFGIRFCFRNYSINKHLATTNTHRKNTLDSFKLFLTSLEGVDPTLRATLVSEVARAIYESGHTGYISDGESPTASTVVEIVKSMKPE